MYAWQKNKAHDAMTFKIQYLDKNMLFKQKRQKLKEIMSFRQSSDIK